ncbi:MAG TPA: NRDE family protein [Magnetospirillaceae bacterium]|nr:NRDE family protein [Magnetospirillaceae bacterium]
MCTVIIARNPDHDWPLLLAGNRDEMDGRPWQPPAYHWPLAPGVLGGLDELADGSWLAVNEHGVVATVLNRIGTLGPATGKRSRGELPIEALDHADAVSAAEALGQLEPAAYRAFNLVVADNRDAFWLRADGETIRVMPIPEGVSILTAGELNDPADPRIAAYLPRFRAAALPDPGAGDWTAWETLLATRAPEGVRDREAGLTFQLETGFGTRSSALIALPSMQHAGVEPVFLFAAGPPDQSPYTPVLL